MENDHSTPRCPGAWLHLALVRVVIDFIPRILPILQQILHPLDHPLEPFGPLGSGGVDRLLELDRFSHHLLHLIVGRHWGFQNHAYHVRFRVNSRG